MLCLPTKAADAQRVVGLNYRHCCERTLLSRRFSCHVILQCLVGNALYESIAESAGGNTECFDCFSSGNVFDDIRVSSTSMDQLSARSIDKLPIRDVARTKLHFLAEGTDIN